MQHFFRDNYEAIEIAGVDKSARKSKGGQRRSERS